MLGIQCLKTWNFDISVFHAKLKADDVRPVSKKKDLTLAVSYVCLESLNK